MITQEIYAHVLPAVRLIVQDDEAMRTLAGQQKDPATGLSLAEHVYGALWSYVTHAVAELRANPSSATEPAPSAAPKDGRSKTWQCVVRFWSVSPLGPVLIAETDPELIQGTGALSAIVAQYAQEVHIDAPMSGIIEAVALGLPQMRNNLGRAGNATLRIPYDVGAESYQCEVNITRPAA